MQAQAHTSRLKARGSHAKNQAKAREQQPSERWLWTGLCSPGTTALRKASLQLQRVYGAASHGTPAGLPKASWIWLAPGSVRASAHPHLPAEGTAVF